MHVISTVKVLTTYILPLSELIQLYSLLNVCLPYYYLFPCFLSLVGWRTVFSLVSHWDVHRCLHWYVKIDHNSFCQPVTCSFNIHIENQVKPLLEEGKYFISGNLLLTTVISQ